MPNRLMLARFGPGRKAAGVRGLGPWLRFYRDPRKPDPQAPEEPMVSTVRLPLFRAAVAAGLLFAPGCANQDNGPSGADEVNILLNNSGTGRQISVTIKFGSFTSSPITVGPGAFVSDEFAGASAGMAITISATAPAGNGFPAATGQITCHAKASIIGTSEYGQVDFTQNGAGNTIIPLCQDSNTWN